MHAIWPLERVEGCRRVEDWIRIRIQRSLDLRLQGWSLCSQSMGRISVPGSFRYQHVMESRSRRVQVSGSFWGWSSFDSCHLRATPSRGRESDDVGKSRNAELRDRGQESIWAYEHMGEQVNCKSLIWLCDTYVNIRTVSSPRWRTHYRFFDWIGDASHSPTLPIDLACILPWSTWRLKSTRQATCKYPWLYRPPLSIVADDAPKACI